MTKWVNCAIVLILVVGFLMLPKNISAGTITSISYGPSGSVVGSYVQAGDIDFVSFTPATALSLASTITITFPSGTVLTPGNIALTDFTIGQATQGNCNIAGIDTAPSVVSVNAPNRTITLTVTLTSLSSGLIPLCLGLGQVTIKTSASAGGDEIQHGTTATTSGTLQINTSAGSDIGQLNTVSLIPDIATNLRINGDPVMSAGSANELTLTAYDQYENVVSFGSNNYNGSKSLTFSGPGNSPNSDIPTVEGVNLGGAVNVTFVNGVSGSNSATLIAYKTESTTVDVSDGSIGSANDPAHDLDLTVEPGDLHEFEVLASTLTPTTDDTFGVTLSARDEYGNHKYDYDGTKSVSWTWSSGGNISPAGNSAQKPEDGNRVFANGTSTLVNGFKIVKVEDTSVTATADTKSGTSDTITPLPGALSTFHLTTQNNQAELPEYLFRLQALPEMRSKMIKPIIPEPRLCHGPGTPQIRRMAFPQPSPQMGMKIFRTAL